MPAFDQPGLLCTEMIAYNGKFFARRPAVVCEDRSLTWAEFDARTSQVANALLGAGLCKGGKVAIVSDNSIEGFETLWGAIRAGGIAVPLSTGATPDVLAAMINNCDAQFLIADGNAVALIEPIRHLCGGLPSGNLFVTGTARAGWRTLEPFVAAASSERPDVSIAMSDSMSIIYSSGTTGAPKGIDVSHLGRHLYTLAYGPMMGITRDTVSICTTPLYANGSWVTMLPTVYWGGCLVLMPKFSGGAFIDLAAKHGGTHAFVVPTQCQMILEAASTSRTDRGSMKVMMVGAGVLNRNTFDQMHAAFPNVDVFVCYGMTEGFITMTTPSDFALGKFGSVGLPLYGTDMRIIDDDGKEVPNGQVGEIVGYGPGLMKGYYRDDARSEEIIWRGPRGETYIRTGDAGYLDEDGYLYLSGRFKDMIKSGGYNIFSADVESVFNKHPDVVETAVVGAPHEKWGETPVLLAIMRPGSKTTEDELMAWGNGQLAKYQRASKVEFRTEFPRGAYDKVLKRVLREPFWNK